MNIKDAEPTCVCICIYTCTCMCVYAYMCICIYTHTLARRLCIYVDRLRTVTLYSKNTDLVVFSR